MYQTTGSVSNKPGDFHMAEVSMKYSLFVPRLYNLSCSLGFEKGKIIPSRAFCSDESQGYPIMLISKHFGTFPFNHGIVGGIVATDRHGPFAHHGKDLIILQASHVGYDPASGRFGVYRRLQNENQTETTNCGKICGTLDWYLHEYELAQNNILLSSENGQHRITIDNRLLDMQRQQGLMLKLDKLVNPDEHVIPNQVTSQSTCEQFDASPDLENYLDTYDWKEDRGEPIGKYLHPDLFFYRRDLSGHVESGDQLDDSLIDIMPYIVTSEWPVLTAAQTITQVEFDRVVKSIIEEPEYKGKKLLFISGLNVDVSPQEGQLFPSSKFIPWAAYLQDDKGNKQTWDQSELFEKLMEQSTENPDQIDLESAINITDLANDIKLPL